MPGQFSDIHSLDFSPHPPHNQAMDSTTPAKPHLSAEASAGNDQRPQASGGQPRRSTGRTAKVRFQLYLTETEVEQLDQLAVKTGLSIAEHARRAIDLYLGAPAHA